MSFRLVPNSVTLDQWQIQDLQTGGRSSAAGARIEAPKAEGAEGVGCGKGCPQCPLPKSFFDYRSQNIDF